jgi:hypothetical protein
VGGALDGISRVIGVVDNIGMINDATRRPLRAPFTSLSALRIATLGKQLMTVAAGCG